MFSFFKSKKQSPEEDLNVTVEPIPSASGNEYNDYIMIEKKQQGGDQPATNLYPSIGGGTLPYPNILPQPVSTGIRENVALHYLHGVPFVLAKELTQADSSGSLSLQTEELLAYIIRKLSLDNMEYDFKLERSIIGSE